MADKRESFVSSRKVNYEKKLINVKQTDLISHGASLPTKLRELRGPHSVPTYFGTFINYIATLNKYKFFLQKLNE